MDKINNISPVEFESIEQYLLGETSVEQRLAFEKRCETDNVLADNINEVKLLLAGIETASLKERLNSYHANIKKNHPAKGRGKIISLKSKFILAASIALFAVVSIWVFTIRGNKYENIYATYYKPDPGLMSAMGVNDHYLFNKAMLDFKTGNYKRAIVEWRKLTTEMPQNDTLNYFLAAALQADRKSTEAITLFASIASDTAKPFYKDACWYTGLALLKKGAIKESVPYFKKSGRPESSEIISKLK